jgi:hypothetical protein
MVLQMIMIYECLCAFLSALRQDNVSASIAPTYTRMQEREIRERR